MDKLEAQQLNPNICYVGETNHRNRCIKFGIKLDDRRRHMYIIGKTGMGKTALLENMVIQDISNGHGCAFVDPHGDTAERLLEYIPPGRINDVVYFNPSDLEYPIAFNILEAVAYEYRHLVASALMGVFTKIWADVWSARMEYVLNNTILAMLEVPGNTMLGVMRMWTDKEFRKKIVSRLRDPLVKAFWINEFANWSEKYRQEAISSVQNKVGQFLSSSIVRNIVGQTKSTIDMRELMDEGKILILNFSKGKIGDDAAGLLGGMVVTRLQTAAMSRVDIPLEEDRRDFFLYVDEFQNFSTKSFADILSEARKYRLSLILAHQFIAQLSEEVRDAVFGNVGTMMTMRIGAADAEFVVKEFEPPFTLEDLVNLPKWKMFLKLMIDGSCSKPFSANTLPPMQEGFRIPGNKEKVIKVSRERYAKPADEVEEKILRWMTSSQEAIEAEVKKEEKPSNAICEYTLKPIHIKFKPDGKRNVFSEEALEKFKRGEIDVKALPRLNPVPPSVLEKYVAKQISEEQLKSMAAAGYQGFEAELAALAGGKQPASPDSQAEVTSKKLSEKRHSEQSPDASRDGVEEPPTYVGTDKSVVSHAREISRQARDDKGGFQAVSKTAATPVELTAPVAEAQINAVCDNCRKDIEVLFTPDHKRNVFCKDCLTKFKRGEIDVRKLPKLNVPPPPSSRNEEFATATFSSL